MVGQGFLLGLSTGTACLATCAPVIVPYLLGEGKGLRQNGLILAQFLTGRLIGYLLFGMAAGSVSTALDPALPGREFGIGLVTSVLAVLMMVYGFSNRPARCLAETGPGWTKKLLRPESVLYPVLMGLFTGINLCPPFLLAIAAAAATGTMAGSIRFFFMFFLGTTLFFLPLPLLAGLHRWQSVRIVGRLAAGIIGCYYLYTGVIMIYGGITRL